MIKYFIKRLLLLVPTILGVSLITFFLLQFLPGGPLEIQLYNSQMNSAESGISSSYSSFNIPEKTLNEMKAYYGFDKPILTRYFIWLKGIVTGNLGNSTYYSEPVSELIFSRIPISLFFGGIGFILTYLICIPLGIAKALRHKSKFDMLTSAIVLGGYTIPGWAFGSLALILFGGGSFFNIFPLGGFVSEDFSTLSFFGKIGDLLFHSVLPLAAYMISGFATLTILTKNSVIDNISQEYVRFAYAKGLNSRRIRNKYILKNSLIPIVTGFGNIFAVVVSGSLLIEKVFNIQGMGLLAFNSILNRDYPVSMGIIIISSFLLIFGNIISDIIYALVDPRIKFK